MTIRPFPPFGLPGNSLFERETIRRINELLQGRANVTLEVTLAAGAATTTVRDARISEQAFVEFMPLTANAATEKGAGTLYVSAQTAGEMTVTHVNNGQTDRTFRLAILG
jgi:hypothetical protein